MERIVLQAKPGKILTDGTHYGKTIYLARGKSADAYYEITEEEYKKIMEAKMKEQQP